MDAHDEVSQRVGGWDASSTDADGRGQRARYQAAAVDVVDGGAGAGEGDDAGEQGEPEGGVVVPGAGEVVSHQCCLCQRV